MKLKTRFSWITRKIKKVKQYCYLGSVIIIIIIATTTTTVVIVEVVARSIILQNIFLFC